jgi:hypothetical protein
MPHALPPAAVVQESFADYQLPSGMIERERKVWLVDLRSERRERAPCPKGTDNEIVVCAPKEDDPARDRLGASLPDAPTAMEEIRQKLHTKIGPAEVGVISGPDWSGVGMRIKF